jgi:hypothetical protein
VREGADGPLGIFFAQRACWKITFCKTADWSGSQRSKQLESVRFAVAVWTLVTGAARTSLACCFVCCFKFCLPQAWFSLSIVARGQTRCSGVERCRLERRAGGCSGAESSCGRRTGAAPCLESNKIAEISHHPISGPLELQLHVFAERPQPQTLSGFAPCQRLSPDSVVLIAFSFGSGR